MAARTPRLDGWQAGQALMTTTDPLRWRQIVEREKEQEGKEKK
jgi:hypothetical protein